MDFTSTFSCIWLNCCFLAILNCKLAGKEIFDRYSNEKQFVVRQKETVTCELQGQLGNQLFEIATTLAYAWDYDLVPVFPDLNRQDLRLSFNRDNLFFRLDAFPVRTCFRNFYIEKQWNSSRKIPPMGDVCLVGYFQCWKLFDHYRYRLLEIFDPSDQIKAHINKKYQILLSNPLTVALHVRTYSEIFQKSKLHLFVGLDYYQKAIALFPKNSLFVVFSDRIEWCKESLKDMALNMVFIEGNNQIEDLYLMSNMKHTIIANSTFSWWGAYLNSSPNKIVVAPRQWTTIDGVKFLDQPNDFYLPDWLIVPVNFDAEVRDEMFRYETNSMD